MTNLGSILKQKFVNKGPCSQSYGFPVIMYGCESWTIRKAECQRIDAFELWCWRRFLRVPWIAKRSNQSILKEINSEYSLEGLLPTGGATPRPNAPGQGRRAGGATPRPRSHGCAGAGGPRGTMAVVRRYPSSKVRSTGRALLEQP